MANKDFKVKNGIDIQSPLPVSMGGTGQTNTTNTLNALLPSQAGNNSKVLSTDGSNTSWIAQAVAYQRGATVARPGSPTVGDLYFNTDLNAFEQYTSAGWFLVAAAPNAPTGVTATNQGSGRAYNNGQASVAFSPATSGGSASSYTITPSPSTSPSTFSGSSSPITVTGLASSTQYTYTATATGSYGTSSASSASSGVTATTVPQAPTISAASASETTATITLTAGATGGAAISQYSIISSPATTTQTTSSSPYTFTGLTEGTSYTFTATATNSNGTSLSSSASNSIIPANPDSGATIPLGVVTVGSGGASTVTFSNIPSTYTHLQIRGIARGGRSDAEQYAGGLYIQLNSNHLTALHQIRSLGASATASGWSGGLNTGYIMMWVPASNANSSIFGAFILDLLDYKNTNKNKVVRMISGNDLNGSGAIAFNSGLWNSTSAITSITFGPTDGIGTIPQYSSFALYGIKGA